MDNLNWVEIKTFPLYQITKCGKIRNKISKKNLNISKDNYSPYKKVSLIKGGKSKNVLYHRLLALTFISNPENKKTVNHKDHNPLNNNLSNLEWSTHSEQNKHKRKTLRRGKTTLKFNLNGILLETFCNKTEAYNSIKVSKIKFNKFIDSDIPLEGFLWKSENISIENEEWKEIKIEHFF